MRRQWFWVIAVALVACGGGQEKTIEVHAQVDALFSVPPTGVACIQLVATAAKKTVSASFGVTPGQSTLSFALNGIPTGRVVFSGQAFSEPCGQSFPDGPTWTADDVTMTVPANQTVAVQLNFRANGNANVSGNFASDDYAVVTIAGTPNVFGSTDGVGGAAQFMGPNGLALSANGRTLFVDDRNLFNNGKFGMTIRTVDTVTGEVRTVAGDPNSTGTTDGPGATARFFRLRAVATAGNKLLIADSCAVRVLDPATNVVSTLIGTRASNPTQWNCSRAASAIGNILDLAVLGDIVYVADASRGVVSKFSLSATPPVVTVVAGTPDVLGTVDGTLSTAQFMQPIGLALPFTTDDILYVSDSVIAPDGLTFWTTIRRVWQNGDSVTTMWGATSTTSRDGLGMNAAFADARRFAWDSGNNLFVGDSTAIRRIDLATATVTTIAGDLVEAGVVDGVGSAARFNGALGIARDKATGVIYIADQGGFAIRKLTPQ